MNRGPAACCIRDKLSAMKLGKALLVLPLLLAAACAEPGPPPNLLLVTVDTLRADGLACYGGEPGAGVSICALADSGAQFVWAFSTAPSTAPSLGSVLTSRYPSGHGLTEAAVSRLREDVVTVTERLRASGYSTAAFVSNPVVARGRGLERGFDVYDDRMSMPERSRPHLVERSAGDTTRAALAWVKRAEPPWFLWVHYQDPHGPYEPPTSRLVGEDVPEEKRLKVLDDHSGRGGIPRYQVLPGLRSFEAYARRYVDEIRYLDEHFRRLIDGVDSLGTPPFVLLTSDHGEAFGEDGYYFAHGHSVGLDQIRVPLLLRPLEPGKERRVVGPASVVDVAPTLLVAAGLEVPESFLGHPLQEAPPGDRAVFAEHRERGAIVLGGSYFARDRDGFDEPIRDPMTGGELTPLPQRVAELVPEGGMPGYREVVPPDEGLEELLAQQIGRADAQRREAARVNTLSEAERDALRALGYLE